MTNLNAIKGALSFALSFGESLGEPDGEVHFLPVICS
jgi:hypothetical protein